MSVALTAELPAIAGGAPAKKTPYGRANRYGEAELGHLKEALEQGTLFYLQGRKVKQLEETFAAKQGVRHAIACSSGTAAIHAALIAVGISPGDEVITSPITDMGTIIPILYQGAIPVFADLHPHNYGLLPDAVEKVVTPRTRAVLAVHLCGNACDLQALRNLCTWHALTLIEDCAQALGCVQDGKAVGGWGEIGCYSFNEYKQISCGEGGMVVTDDPELAVRLRLATDKCYDRRPDSRERTPQFLANNYRMTELQAAVVLAQLEKLDEIVVRRRRWAQGLTEAIQTLHGLHMPLVLPGSEPSWYVYLLRVTPDLLGADASTFSAALNAEGVPAGAHYIGKPVYRYPLFENRSLFAHGSHPAQEHSYPPGLCPIAEQILDDCISLTIHEAFTEDDLAETIAAFRKVAAWYQDKN